MEKPMNMEVMETSEMMETVNAENEMLENARKGYEASMASGDQETADFYKGEMARFGRRMGSAERPEKTTAFEREVDRALREAGDLIRMGDNLLDAKYEMERARRNYREALTEEDAQKHKEKYDLAKQKYDQIAKEMGEYA